MQTRAAATHGASLRRRKNAQAAATCRRCSLALRSEGTAFSEGVSRAFR
jgi:hypothetical protein